MIGAIYGDVELVFMMIRQASASPSWKSSSVLSSHATTNYQLSESGTNEHRPNAHIDALKLVGLKVISLSRPLVVISKPRTGSVNPMSCYPSKRHDAQIASKWDKKSQGRGTVVREDVWLHKTEMECTLYRRRAGSPSLDSLPLLSIIGAWLLAYFF